MRESGIESLVGSIKSLGFVFTSQLTVSEPHEGETKYHLIDGAHRWAAVCKLGQDEDQKISEKYKDYVFTCHVLPPLKHKQEMAVAYGNYYLLIYQQSMKQQQQLYLLHFVTRYNIFWKQGKNYLKPKKSNCIGDHQ